jgi:hypothetical protein
MSKLSEVLQAQRSHRDGGGNTPERGTLETPPKRVLGEWASKQGWFGEWLFHQGWLDKWPAPWLDRLSPEAQRRIVGVVAIFPSVGLAIALHPSPGRSNTFFWLTLFTLSLWGAYSKEPIWALEKPKRPIYQQNVFLFPIAIAIPWLLVFGLNIFLAPLKLLGELFAVIAFIVARGRWAAYAKSVREKGEAAIIKNLRKKFGSTTDR